jgi:hypothetical protein
MADIRTEMNQLLNYIQFAFAQYVVRRDTDSHASVRRCIDKARALIASGTPVEQCTNCGMSVDPRCNCESGHAALASNKATAVAQSSRAEGYSDLSLYKEQIAARDAALDAVLKLAMSQAGPSNPVAFEIVALLEKHGVRI